MPFLYSSESGQSFTFQEYDFHNTTWYHGVGGVYIFARYSNLSNAWNCIYIGETDSFGRRMYQHKHDKWPEAVELGAHAVLATVMPNENVRKTLEKELIRRFPTILNKKDNPLNSSSGCGLSCLSKNTLPLRYNSQSQLGLGILKGLYRH